jgi:hypothetical protein
MNVELLTGVSAVDQLTKYKPALNALNNEQVQPLLQFFELIHQADVIHQMVYVYYKEEVVNIRLCDVCVSD